MNERIQELAEQARQYAEDKQNDPLKIYTLDCFNKKFAELIVAECASRLVDMDQQVKGQHNYYKHASIQVLLHFGIQP